MKSLSRTRSRAATSSCRHDLGTTKAFPAWRRTLRQAVINAPDRPERARPWIFAVENEDVMS